MQSMMEMIENLAKFAIGASYIYLAFKGMAGN